MSNSINLPERIDIKFSCVSLKDSQLLCGNICFSPKTNRDYFLIKNGNVWNLTTCTANKKLYDLSKNSEFRFYIALRTSIVKYRYEIHAVNKILTKECFTLLLEFNHSNDLDLYMLKPLILNLKYDPFCVKDDSNILDMDLII